MSPTPLVGAVVIAVAALYLIVTPGNPPGFSDDEAAIAYNASTIARSGQDESGSSWPLFFRSFGDYKSPAYIYLLAAAFKVASPSILAARYLSALLGLAAVLLLGYLGRRISGRSEIGAALVLLGALNPWLYEISRLVFEVALFPLVLVLFLVLLHRAQGKPEWTGLDCVTVALPLGLLAYTYPTGRLLAPLLALGLVAFSDRERWRRIVMTWLVFGTTLVPLLVFALQHPGALSERFVSTTYITRESSPLDSLREFGGNYLSDLNLYAWILDGDPNLRHHVPGTGSLLAATVVLAAGGVVLALRRHRTDPWLRFALYGLAVSIVPAALTVDRRHTLRMIPFPIFVLVFTIPALAWFMDKARTSLWVRVVFASLIGATLLQSALFQWHFRQDGPGRGESFEAAYPDVFEAATAEPSRPIYVYHVLGLWYATVQGVDTRDLVYLEGEQSAPPSALVVGDAEACVGCRVIAKSGSFAAYVTPRP